MNLQAHDMASSIGGFFMAGTTSSKIYQKMINLISWKLQHQSITRMFYIFFLYYLKVNYGFQHRTILLRVVL